VWKIRRRAIRWSVAHLLSLKFKSLFALHRPAVEDWTAAVCEYMDE
jgi:hypothetical protein